MRRSAQVFVRSFTVVLASCALALAATAATATATPWPLPDDALVLTHPSRHYHTAPETIATTNALVHAAFTAGRTVVALAQNDIATDPDWYASRGAEITHAEISDAGENDLAPRLVGDHFHVTLAGGYHSACLGWTMAELVSRFLQTPGARTIDVTLPTRAIFTGFLHDAAGALVPAAPEDEAKADDSIDGLSLAGVSAPMDDAAWGAFAVEELRWAIFEKAPMLEPNLRYVDFELWRDARLVRTMRAPGVSTAGAARQTVRLRYVSAAATP